jgi:hypothetical protein
MHESVKLMSNYSNNIDINLRLTKSVCTEHNTLTDKLYQYGVHGIPLWDVVTRVRVDTHYNKYAN